MTKTTATNGSEETKENAIMREKRWKIRKGVQRI